LIASTLLLVWALVTWVALFQAFSVQRGQAALLPVAVLVARLPTWLAWLLALVAAAIAVWMENYFLDGTLISFCAAVANKGHFSGAVVPSSQVPGKVEPVKAGTARPRCQPGTVLSAERALRRQARPA
jgi:hypothetical protein